MKKTLLFITLTLILIFAIVACDSPAQTPLPPPTTPAPVETPPPPPPTPDPTPEPTPELEPEPLGVEIVIEELTNEYSSANGVKEFEIEADWNDKITVAITFYEPHERDDFPSLVVPFVDNVIKIANENDVSVEKLRVNLNLENKQFVYYNATSDSGKNEEFKVGKMMFHSFRYAEDGDLIDYDKLFTLDEGIEAFINKWNDLITITGFSTSRPNSAGGVNMTITWRNESDNEIKYIKFAVEVYNAVDDTVKCEIRGNSLTHLEFTGPFKKGTRNTSTERNAWYNKDIKRAELYSLDIEYMDGTKETLRSNFVGFDEWWNS